MNLISSPYITRCNIIPQPPLGGDILFQSHVRSTRSSSPATKTPSDPLHENSAYSDSIVKVTQFSISTTPSTKVPSTPSNNSPIKAIPIQALTPNGSICVLPGTPQLGTKKRCRRSSRLLNCEDGNDTATRIEKAALAKSLEMAPSKKTSTSTTTLGSIELPVLDFTDDELAMLSTATRYQLPPSAIEAISSRRPNGLGSMSA